jgi:hypothetical protein
MPEDAPRPAQAAIRTDLGAIFVSLELSRRAWLITSLSPGGGVCSLARAPTPQEEDRRRSRPPEPHPPDAGCVPAASPRSSPLT